MPSNTIHTSEYTFSSPKKQLFAFPPDMISSMLENPSSHIGLLKLYQTCKYFWSKRPILIADYIMFGMIYSRKSPILNVLLILESPKNISQLRIPIWAIDTVSLQSCYDQNLQLLKFFRNSIERIDLFDSKLRFEDFVLLTSENKVEIFKARGTFSFVFHNNEDEMASSDKVLQHLPNILEFSFFIDENCSEKILTNLNGMKFNNKFKALALEIYDVHSTFDLRLFCEFVMKNTDLDSDVQISICNEDVIEKLKLGFDQMDPKRKLDAHIGLKNFFLKIDHNWIVEISK